MSDNKLEDDLFGGPDDDAPPRPPSPAASSSRASTKPEQSGTVTPAVENNEDEDGDGIGADLFGDDDDEKHASPRRREGTSPDTPVSLRSSRSPNPLEYAEEDVRDPGNQEQTWASMPFPKWDGLKPTDGKIWQLRLPAYVNMESTPYDPTLFRKGIEPLGEEEELTVKRSRMISVRNTIRWKWVTGDDGEPKRQSNSRLLRWSDGSVSLQLGSDLYDLAPSYGTTLARASDPPPKNPLPEKPPGANTTFLVYSSSSDEVLMTENTIAGQVSLVPASSSSKTHIELVKHVGQQHVKHSRMKVLEEVVDPEKAHAAAAGGGKRRAANRGAGGGGARARKLKRDSSDEEEDSRYTYDADAPRRGGARGGPKGFEAEYDEDDGFVVADSDEDGEGEEEEGDDDGDYGGGSSKKSKSKSKAKKRKGSEELDEMEEMERRIEASEREKKRARRDRKEKSRRRDYETDEEDEEPAPAAQPDQDAEGEEEDMDMDVESEED